MFGIFIKLWHKVNIHNFWEAFRQCWRHKLWPVNKWTNKYFSISQEMLHFCTMSKQLTSFLHFKHNFYTHARTHAQPFNGFCPGQCRPVPEETFTHSHPSWSLDILYHFPPFTTIHGILFVHFMCLTILSDNLSPGPLWSSSWSWILNFILHTFLHPIIIIFSQHMPIPTQPVTWYQLTRFIA